MSAVDEVRLRELFTAATARFAGPELKSDGYGNQVWAKSLKGGDTHVVDIRGWGYLTGRGHGALALTEEEGIAAQKAVQAYVVAAWNAVPELLDALSAERERGDRAVGLLRPFGDAADFWEPLFPDAEPMMKPAAFVDRWRKLHGRKAAVPQFTVGDLKGARRFLATQKGEGAET